MNRRRLLLNPLLAVAAEIEIVDRLRQRGIRAIALPLPASVGERRKFRRLAVFAQKHARLGLCKDCVHLGAQPLRLRQNLPAVQRRILVPGQAVRQLARQRRGKAADRAHQRLGKAAAAALKRRGHGLRRKLIKGQLAVRRRTAIVHAGHDLAEAGNILGDSSRALDNSPVGRHKNQVRMLSHELSDQRLARVVAKLVDVLERKLQNAVAFRLPHAQKPPAQQMLAQKHAQVRRLQRVRFFDPREMRAGARGACGQQQLVIFAAVSNQQDHLVPLRLRDLVHAAARKRLVQFLRNHSKGYAVHRHGQILSGHFVCFRYYTTNARPLASNRAIPTPAVKKKFNHFYRRFLP